MNDTIKESIRTFVLDNFLQGESPANLRDDTRLKTSGVLDSLATLNLVTFLEKTFGIEIEAHETGVENFETIDDMSAFVARKLSAA